MGSAIELVDVRKRFTLYREKSQSLKERVKDLDQRRRRDQRRSATRAGLPHAVPSGPPWKERVAEHEPRPSVAEDERAVRQVAERGAVQPSIARHGIHALGMESGVDRGCARLAVQVPPKRGEARHSAHGR